MNAQKVSPLERGISWASTIFILGAMTFVASLGLVIAPAAFAAQESAFIRFFETGEVPRVRDYLSDLKKFFPLSWKIALGFLIANLGVLVSIPFWVASPKMISIAALTFILPIAVSILLVELVYPLELALHRDTTEKITVLKVFSRLAARPIKSIALFVITLVWASINYAIPTIIPVLGFSIMGLLVLIMMGESTPNRSKNAH
jgi:uncharacterized membrane protein YesL